MTKDVVCKKCGGINDYKIVEKSVHHMAFCNGCGAFIKNIGYQVPQFFFGKMKDKKVDEVTDRGYLEWFLKSDIKKSESMIEAIEKQIEKLKSTQLL